MRGISLPRRPARYFIEVSKVEKLCLFCKHFRYAKRDMKMGSTWTGPYGEEGGLTCEKGHYFEIIPEDETEMRQYFLRAETCKDYSPPESA